MRGKSIIFFFLLAAGLSECTTSVSEIGADFFTKNTFDIGFIDSMTMKVSTVLRDSMVTSDAKRLLVGFHNDERLGTITCQGVFQVGINNAIFLDKQTTIYQGLRLHLKKDGYYFYDTTKSQTLSVYRLTKGITTLNGAYYNTSKFSIDKNNPLGSLTFFPRPVHTTDSIEIPLPDDLGRQLMTMANENDFRLATNEEFIKFFKGMALLPDTVDSRAIVGFTATPEMRLYYYDQSVSPTVQRYIRFGVVNGNPHFNHVHSSRTGTQLSSLKKVNQTIPSTLTENESYIQCGAGLGIRIEIPYLRKLLDDDPTFTCSRAVLYAIPVNGSYRTQPLPPVLAMYPVDAENNIISSGAPGAFRYITSYDISVPSSYQADLTPFVNSQILNSTINNNALLILLDDSQYRSTVNRVYLGDQQSIFTMQLKLYFLTLPNQLN